MGKKGTNGETAKFRDEKTAAFYRAVAEFLPPERLFTDALRTLAWGTDAGFYRQIPQIVVFPKNEEEAARILREADRMKTQIIEEARGAAQIEAQKVMDAAKVSIEQSRKEAEQNFRNEVNAFAIEIATKVVRNNLADTKAQASLVNSLLDELENKN